MHQMENTISISLIILTLSIFSFPSFAQKNSMSSADLLEDSVFELDDSRDSNLGKRVYDYLSEYKRYPLFNFGLGKRSSRAYSFGLGKRLDENGDDGEEYDEYINTEEDDHVPELELYPDDVMQDLNKRQKMYSFGLGKRLHRYDFGLGKRTQMHKFNFGLGKRSQPSANRNKLYNFGLGKRNRMYAFGLGKRPYNQGPVSGRFNFGLGKRSENVDILKSVIAKRETHEDNPIPITGRGDYGPTDSSQTSTTEAEKPNTGEMESREMKDYFEKYNLSKRSPYRHAFEMEKPAFRPNSGFSRQFRNPLYNFGLGKRMPSSNNSASKSTISRN